MRLLLDTTVLIDALRSRHGRREMLAALVREHHTLATSALNVAEVYTGLRTDEEDETGAFLSALDCYDITAPVGQLAGKLKNQWAKKGQTIALADALVAAVALENECMLMTDNGKDFPMPELRRYPIGR